MNIAVDAMGGDHAPEVVVQGAVKAADELGVNITLVGHEKAILRNGSLNGRRIGVHHCEEVVEMHEPPLKAIRRKKDASIRVAFDLMRRGLVDAVVSAGHSGATLAAGILCLGRMRGIDRPAIAGILPGEKGKVILIDAGANVDCRPGHLFQFGIMGNAFAVCCLGMENPRVGLLSIGEEREKGNEQVRIAHKLFNKSPLNFVGNVEGGDIFSGEVQIVVCDGFVGNVALKLSEGMARAFSRMLQGEMCTTLAGRAGLRLGARSLGRLRNRLDHEEYGGAPILGLKGVGIVCHGNSSARAIRNAVKMADDYVRKGFQERLARRMADLQTGSKERRWIGRTG